MHYFLLRASKQINSVYSIHFFIFIVEFCQHIVLKIYMTIIDCDFDDGYIFEIHEMLIALLYFIYLFSITASCHFVSLKVS